MKQVDTLFGTQKQQLKHLTANEYKALKQLCALSKNMYNVALFQVRQHFFANKQFLSYNSNYHCCKHNENFAILNSNSAQQILKVVDRNCISFRNLIKKAKKGAYSFKQINLPHYLPKDGFFDLIFSEFNVSKDIFTVPMSPEFKHLFGKVEIKIPSNLKEKTIKEVRIIPKYNARFFEIQWVYEIQESKESLNQNNVLAIDVGVDNLCTCTTNDGHAFVLDGKRLKSIKDKQHQLELTKAQRILWTKRNNQVNDYLNKAVAWMVNYCVTNQIGTIVMGYNKTIQKKVSLGKRNNQNFVNIPMGVLKKKLIAKSKRHGIILLEQEESYTSKADFFANDTMPVYDAKDQTVYQFSGKRISRGQYRSVTGVVINADVNGSLNIMRKANVATIILTSHEYFNPKRIKIV